MTFGCFMGNQSCLWHKP